MKIAIEYNGSRMKAYLGDDLYFNGSLKKKFWKDVWHLRDETKLLFASYTINGKFWEYNFPILIESNEVDILLHYKFKKPHFYFTKDEDNYLIVFHLKDKFSFFKNDKQFAFMMKVRNGSFFKKELVIKMDDKADLQLLYLLSIAVILFTYHIDKDPEYSSIGSWFKEYKEFDEEWEPS